MSDEPKAVTTNRKAFHDYEIIEKFEAGLELRGSEVKSLREGKANLRDSYAVIRDGEVILMGMHIGAYSHTGYLGHEPYRDRKLLLHKQEIRSNRRAGSRAGPRSRNEREEKKLMPKFPPIKEQMDLIRRGTAEIISEEELLRRLERAEKKGQPLIVKLGCDPSRPDLHIGHAVVLRKLRHFQDLGHQSVLVVGDFTALIGDPSGRNKTRPHITPEEVDEYAETYIEQAGHILDLDTLKIVRNGDWLGAMNFHDVIKLASHYTVARMLERDDFEKRYKSEVPISIHEFLYPLAQAMDSVELEVDIELGGTDGRTASEKCQRLTTTISASPMNRPRFTGGPCPSPMISSTATLSSPPTLMRQC